MSASSQAHLNKVVRQLNERPRKALGIETPAERFCKCCVDRLRPPGKTSPTTLVREIMEQNVVCVRPEQSVELCMALMTDNRVRHLPVLEGKKVIGIISIGDLLKSIISKQKFVIDELEHYIHG